MAASSDNSVYEAFLNYDFENDQQFQSGMASILKQADGNPDTREQTLERAQWFYYNKFVQAFDFDEYRQWRDARDSNENTDDATTRKSLDPKTSDEEDKPPKFTFQELVEMIESGKEIPGIRQIPNKLNDGTPSQPKLSVRRKPWETAREEEQQQQE